MTLAEIIDLIKQTALSQPNVRQVVDNDVYTLNSIPDAKYGVFVWLQGQHRETFDGIVTYTFTFFYVDRLTEDGGNQVEVQSVGLQTLGNIVRSLNESGLEAESWNYTTFNQRFNDMCAGVFCNVELETTVDYTCVDEIN